MKIRVLKASKPTYWYASKVGEEFDATKESNFNTHGYRVEDCRDGSEHAGYVAVEDCEIVEEAEGMEKVTVLTDELGLQREYREVKRKAKVGERVKATEDDDHYGYATGDILTVTDSDRWGDGAGISCDAMALYHREYVVLEPLGSAADAPQPNASEQQAQIDGLIETVANLARRVAELERGQAPGVGAEPVVEKTLTRDEIIEKAKADVAELIRVGDDIDARLPQESPFYSKFYRVKFSVNRKKRTIVALIRHTRVDKETVRSRGIAKCAPSDCFNVHIGMAIALRRALGLDIPEDYRNAPQPDEVRVGDVVIATDSGYLPDVKGVVQSIVDDGHGGLWYKPNNRDAIYDYQRDVKILDDSRDGRYGEVYSV